jgi:DHA2 family multidrug resistance protein
MSTPQGRKPTHKWVIAATVLTGTIMAVLDSSIVNVALPDMSGNLGATLEEITWVVTAYILAQVIIMPITGLLASRFGRKRFYMASVVLFTAASMACGLARDMGFMVLFRIVQGIGGGVLLTVSQAILRESFPREEQGIAMGLYGLGVVLAPAFGPTLGGWITDQYSWPWVFYINVPIGALNLLLVARFIEDPPYLIRQKGQIDWPGLGLLVVGLGSLQLMLAEGERRNWFDSGFIVRLGILAAIGLLLFVWRELNTERPAVNLRILRNASLSSATALGGVLGFALYGSLFLLPIMLQRLLGFNAMQSGLTMMPRSLAMGVLMPIAGRSYNRLGPRVLVGLGLFISGIGFFTMSRLTTSVGYWDLFWPQVWQGVGFSLIFVALSTAALSTIAKARMTDATGLYNVVRQVMGSVGVAVAATTLSGSSARYHAILAAEVGPGSVGAQWIERITAAMVGQGADVFTARAQALRIMDGRIARQAAILAYNHVFALIALLFVVSVPLVILLRHGKHEEDEEAAIAEV